MTDERAQKDAERAQEEAKRAQEEAERARDAVTAPLRSMRLGLIDQIARRFAQRGLVVTEDQRARMIACEDDGQPLEWLDHAAAAATVEGVFER